MDKLKYTAITITSLLMVGLGSAFGGQALFAPISDFYGAAALVAIVDVKKVTPVAVSTGDDQMSTIYVAEAEVLETLKSDHDPQSPGRKIAIVGSTISKSSAVWEPIKNGRYLAFLNPEQGHYRYSEKYAMRPLDSEGKVEWLEKDAEGGYELYLLNIEDAVRKVRAEGNAGSKSSTHPDSR